MHGGTGFINWFPKRCCMQHSNRQRASRALAPCFAQDVLLRNTAEAQRKDLQASWTHWRPGRMRIPVLLRQHGLLLVQSRLVLPQQALDLRLHPLIRSKVIVGCPS